MANCPRSAAWLQYQEPLTESVILGGKAAGWGVAARGFVNSDVRRGAIPVPCLLVANGGTSDDKQATINT